MRLESRVLLAAVVFGWFLAPTALHGQSVVWDANKESDIAGYRVHRGTESGKYTSQIDVGNKTTYQPTDVDWSRRQFFAVQAYNSSGLMSALSAEVQWTPPSVTKITGISASSGPALLVGKPVSWTASATNNLGPVEYRFWLYRRTGWVMVREYGTGDSWTWTPAKEDVGEPYHVQVWVRAVGSTAQYEAWLGTAAFSVTVNPFELTADVDFPTPPANQVTWTATVAGAGTTPLEYQFWVKSENSGLWSLMRNYGPSNQAQWTPESVGKYAVQAWARRIGSTADFETSATTPFFEVSRTPLSVTGLSVDTSFPVRTGTKITWTARVKGGMSGPVQYQFWLHSPRTGWTLAQPYGPSQRFSWTPTWGDEGDHALQVWVRSNGSTANYESWRATGMFSVQRALLHLTTNTLFPVAPGSHVKWAADVPDPSVSFEYQFWIYSGTTASWSLGKSYGMDKTFTWIPTVNGSYAVQAWARQPGSSVAYDLYRGTGLLEVSQTSPQVKSLTSDVPLPAKAGTTITWTAAASGGTGPLQYQFWIRQGETWVMVQDYSLVNTYTWATTSADIGQHHLQVWVRSTGSSEPYEAYMGSGAFSIQP